MVKEAKRVGGVVAILIFGSMILGGCHGAGDGSYTERWVSSADRSQVLEMSFPNLSFFARVHVAIFGTRLKGSYVLRNGSATTEGTVTQDSEEFILVSAPDGREQQFHITGSSSLRDESGTIWSAEVPSLKKELKSW